MQTRYRSLSTEQQLCQIVWLEISINYPKDVAATWTCCRFVDGQNVQDLGAEAAGVDGQRKYPPRAVVATGPLIPNAHHQGAVGTFVSSPNRSSWPNWRMARAAS